tara:strand:- start:809 stop:2272 length:1464 start_codon:yes stop_codon:yes gene_type:complete
MSTDELQYAGEFVVERAIILTSEGMEINIKKLLISLDLYEDIRTNSITGTLIMQDPLAMSSTAPLLGQEYLSLRIKTPSRTKTELFNFTDDLFTINRILDKADISGHQAYTIHVVTHEQMKNLRTRIHRVLNGTESDIVEQLITSDIKSKKDLYIEPTAGVRKIIPSNIRPFDIINQLSKTASSKEENSPTYFFYETAKGYHFRSLESMYAQTPKFNFTSETKDGNNTKEGLADVITQLNQIESYQVSNGNDSVLNLKDGVYGSKLITHDIFNKKLDTFTYNYHESFEKQKHINHYDGNSKDNPMYSSTPLEESSNPLSVRISDFPMKTYITAVSRTSNMTHDSSKQQKKADGTVGEFNISPYNPEHFLMTGVSRKLQLTRGFTIKIETKGNTALNAGDVVNCTIDINAAPDGAIYKDGKDRFYKGRFLVVAIKNSFDFGEQLHTSTMSLTKDSVGNEQLISPSDAYETRPLKDGKIIRSFYDSPDF